MHITYVFQSENLNKILYHKFIIMSTPEEISQKIDDWSKKHLSKFENVDKLLSNNNVLVWAYFWKQSLFDDINDFKNHLKSELERYRDTVEIIDNEEQDDIVQELVENIVKKYPKLVFLWEHIPFRAKEAESFENKFPIISIMKRIVGKILWKN